LWIISDFIFLYCYKINNRINIKNICIELIKILLCDIRYPIWHFIYIRYPISYILYIGYLSGTYRVPIWHLSGTYLVPDRYPNFGTCTPPIWYLIYTRYILFRPVNFIYLIELSQLGHFYYDLMTKKKNKKISLSSSSSSPSSSSSSSSLSSTTTSVNFFKHKPSEYFVLITFEYLQHKRNIYEGYWYRKPSFLLIKRNTPEVIDIDNLQ